MNVYRIELPGSGLEDAYYSAKTRSKARIQAALDLVDAGHYRRVGTALRRMKCKSVGVAPPDRYVKEVDR